MVYIRDTMTMWGGGKRGSPDGFPAIGNICTYVLYVQYSDAYQRANLYPSTPYSVCQ